MALLLTGNKIKWYYTLNNADPPPNNSYHLYVMVLVLTHSERP